MEIVKGKTYRRIDGILRRVTDIITKVTENGVVVDVHFEWWNPERKSGVDIGHSPYLWFKEFTLDEYKEKDSAPAVT